MVRPSTVLGIPICLALCLHSPGIAQGVSVHHVKLAGSLTEESFVMIEHVLQQAGTSGSAAVVVELDVDSDKIELADEIAGMIAEASIPVFAYVNRRALNAAALLSLAADSIYMSPDATLGGNNTVNLPLVISRDTAEVRVADLFGDYAARHGVDRRIGEAMVDPSVRYGGPGAQETRITLTTERALELGLAVAVANTVDSLLAQIRLANARVRTVERDWLATTVTVENNNWRDINVFVRLSGGMQLRMGTVTSMNSSTYTVPANILFKNSYIRVVAEIIGSDDRIQTETVRVVPGLVIQWRIENVLQNSNYFVWIRS